MTTNPSLRRYLALASVFFTLHGSPAAAATPEQEKAFVDAYRKALETSDTATLQSFLHTKGADTETIEFFKMMQGMGAGTKPSSITLVTPTAEEAARFDRPMKMPTGTYKLAVKPVRQLVIVNEDASSNGTSKSTSTVPVAEIDGRLVIPLPVPVAGKDEE